jgi:RNA polymerase sigma factor (sigma-70 family)
VNLGAVISVPSSKDLIDSMPPPPAEPFAARIFLGPALRTQPDRRLVKLVREGYETAFEEIVRRYRKPLDRFAAAIVGGRSEDVTQDAFSKALLALRGSETEIELRPWLYRIVRNTALNDLRDGPPLTEELAETIAGGHSAAVEAERREEIAELMSRLRALPEPQRAAIVMRELEGLSHEEIAAALGVSGGAARQAIYRARAALRDGLGLLLPLPLLRMLFDHGAEAAGAGAGGIAAAGAASAGGGGATLGTLGAGGALKVGLATALIAGSLGAGVAVQQNRGGSSEPSTAAAAGLPGAGGGGAGSTTPSSEAPAGEPRLGAAGGSHGSADGSQQADHHGSGGGSSSNSGFDDSSHLGDDSTPGGSSGHGGPGPSRSGHSGSGEDSSDDHSGEGTSGGGSHSGGRGSGGGDDGGSSGGGSSHGGSGSDDVGGGDSGSGSSGGGSGSSGHGGGSDSPESAPSITTPPPIETPTDDGGGSGSGSSGPGDGSGSGDPEAPTPDL